MESRQIPRRQPGASPASQFAPHALGALVVLATAWISFSVLSTMGLATLVLLLGGLIVASLLVFVSNKNRAVIIVVWFLFMSGFHVYGMVRMPGLPDFSFPRLFLIWFGLLLVMNFLIKGNFLKRPLLPDVLIITHTIYVLVQLHLTESRHFHLWYMSNLSPLIAYLVAKYLVNDEKTIRLLLIALMVSLLYFVIVAFGEHFEIRALVWPKVIMDRSVGKWWEGRARGPFLQPGVFGDIIGMYVLVALFLLTRRLPRAVVIALLGIVALGLLSVFFTMTRGCWVAMAFGLLVLAVLRPRYRKVFLAFGVVLAIGGSIGLLQVMNNDRFSERMSNVTTLENRLGVAAVAFRVFQEKPLFGVGFFRFDDVKKRYTTGAHVPFYGFIKAKLIRGAVIHDMYIGRLAEEGLVSVILLGGFLLACGRSFARKWRANPQEQWFDRDLLSVCAGIIVLYLVAGLFMDLRYFDLVNVIPFFCAGLIVGYGNDRYLRA